jgi:hypothetical protein
MGIKKPVGLQIHKYCAMLLECYPYGGIGEVGREKVPILLYTPGGFVGGGSLETVDGDVLERFGWKDTA